MTPHLCPVQKAGRAAAQRGSAHLRWGDESYIAEHYPADAKKNELREVAIMPE
jgi:hypothetical protein